MVGTAVPPATVHEDGDLLSAEQDIGLTPEFENGSPVDPVSKPSTMQFSSERQFRCRIPLRLASHPQARGL